ncbi:MAG: amino acid permease [Oscillibacter sp.]|jgi:aromatic amino acid permease|nr:amino acid permease [Bacillota bacterium]MCI7203151.1 amino acid permease [Oscillibacter sp.]MDR3979706.1 amino acid permease [Oscillospiraceae bacterium]RHU67654.1 amino acid permease [Ruminococcaceae bacterium TF06-43]HJH82584.1 amino acid permease [Clostridiales bacterium]
MEEKNLHVEEGALKVTKLTLYEAVAIIVGANVGSGILGLAYSSRLAGWPILVLWLAVAGLFTTFSMLYVAESALRTKKPLQLPGLAEKYVGKVGSVLIFISVCANSIGCMVAYTTGSGNILCTLLGLPNWAGSLLFTVPCVLVVWFGLKATGLWEKFMSTGMVVLLGIIVIASFLSGKADVSRAVYANWTYAVPLLSSAIFCYIAQYAVPELARGMRHTPKKLPVAIILGMFITGVLLAVVPLAVLSLTGAEEVTQVATLAWGQALGTWALYTANIFALCAMMTSYWAVGGSMLTNIVDMFKLKDEKDTKTRLIAIACTVLPPFILAYAGLVSFVDAIGWAGTFGGVIMSIVPVLMLNNARKKGDIEPEWKCGWYAHPAVQGMIIVIFSLAAIYFICSMIGILPAGW